MRERLGNEFEQKYNLLFENSNKFLNKFKLEKFKFILLNSSIDPRKNIIMAVNAFLSSSLPSLGIKLCIVGQLKDDNYSIKLKEISKSTKSVVFWHMLGWFGGGLGWFLDFRSYYYSLQ